MADRADIIDRLCARKDVVVYGDSSSTAGPGSGAVFGPDRICVEAADEIARLREQVARQAEMLSESGMAETLALSLKCPKDHHWGPGPDPRPECSEVAKLREQVAALTADAERYRWMTTHRLGWFSRMAPLPWQKQTMKDALDAAIDAARKDQT